MKTTILYLGAIAGVLAVSGAAASATIIQDDSDYVAFEAEIAAIDNSGGGSSTAGWVIDGATVYPASPSGGSFVVNLDRQTSSPPNDTLTFDIDLSNDGAYRPWFRVAWSDEDTTQAGNFHDSWYFQSGTDGADWTEDNNNSVSTSEWRWYDGGVDVTFTSDGLVSWAVSSREDWLIMDRIVLISEDNTDTVDADYLDGLANSIPEPATLALLGLGGLGALARRRRA